LGHLFAGQIANLLSLRDPEEHRTLLLGLGLEKPESNSDGFYDLMELLQQIL
jgi:proteasome assembly chaperone 3